MSALALRILVFLAIAAAIAFGVGRIWRDWKEQFKRLDAAARERDLRERARPDVITLRRSDDGVFRPGERESE